MSYLFISSHFEMDELFSLHAYIYMLYGLIELDTVLIDCYSIMTLGFWVVS